MHWHIESLKQALDSRGYCLIESFTETHDIAQCLTELQSAFTSKAKIQVDANDIKIQTINGDALLDLCPSVSKLYHTCLEALQRDFDQVFQLEDNQIGISANYLWKSDDSFRLHFDRNQVTVVIYLNDCEDFPLIIYPNVRPDPVSTGLKEAFNLQAFTEISIPPRQNTALVFYGRRCFHGVRFEGEALSAKPRYSLQFAYDLQANTYEGESYYGQA